MPTLRKNTLVHLISYTSVGSTDSVAEWPLIKQDFCWWQKSWIYWAQQKSALLNCLGKGIRTQPWVSSIALYINCLLLKSLILLLRNLKLSIDSYYAELILKNNWGNKYLHNNIIILIVFLTMKPSIGTDRDTDFSRYDNRIHYLLSSTPKATG